MRQGSIGKQNARTHGHTAGRRFSRAYKSWAAMRRRCLKPWASNYRFYGGRGIGVCERWMRFENFLADMGNPDDGMTLDRIDSNGDYEPSNCRWIPQQEQNRNRRSNRLLTCAGQTRCLAEWAEITGVSSRAIWGRLHRGWSIERALGYED